MKNKPKIIVILGTTASGKTKLGVDLARQFNGEIISADSRQVYRGLDVGSGKDLSEYGSPLLFKDSPSFRRRGWGGLDGGGSFVPYHLIDIADPKDRFSVAEYQRQAFATITDILSRGKLPIIVGGSGQYLEAVVENYQLAEVKPDDSLREELENLSVEELFNKLKEKNSDFALKLNNSDKNNKRRLIRYLEVFSNVAPKSQISNLKSQEYDFLLLGLTHPKEVLSEKIHERLIARLENENMIQEVSDLHDKIGLSWDRLEEFGLEYKFIAQYLQEKLDYDQMVEQIDKASNQFAKKQMTWFKRWEKKRKIIWLEGERPEKIIADFLNK
jgi:tRNA delta(2)-isopentenylpyrophosphate transferase